MGRDFQNPSSRNSGRRSKSTPTLFAPVWGHHRVSVLLFRRPKISRTRVLEIRPRGVISCNQSHRRRHERRLHDTRHM